MTYPFGGLWVAYQQCLRNNNYNREHRIPYALFVASSLSNALKVSAIKAKMKKSLVQYDPWVTVKQNLCMFALSQKEDGPR